MAGNVRLQDTEDFVRIEIEAALARGIPIVPVVLPGATDLDKVDIPESMEGLRVFQVHRVRLNPDFRSDVEGLIARVSDLLPPPPQKSAQADSTR